MRILTAVILLMSMISLTATEALALNRFTVAADDSEAEDRFGWSVSLSGNTMAVGAMGSGSGASGAVYIFRYVGVTIGWRQAVKLTETVPGMLNLFGVSVSLDGDVLLVGCPYGGPVPSGCAYVFRFDGSTWVEEAQLIASDAAGGDLFGGSVSLDGNVAVIGAPQDDDKGEKSGSVYIFRYDGTSWVEQDKVVAGDGEAGDGLGDSVSVDGDVLVAGAWGDDVGGADSGSAYVFRYNGDSWIEEEDTLIASDAAAGDEFGRSVAVSGDKIIAGAFGHDGRAANTGSAYIFKYDGANWIQEANLSASDAQAGDGFGRGVDIQGDRVAVGAYGDRDDEGSILWYRYDETTWVPTAYLFKLDGTANAYLGWSVSIEGDHVAVGAPRLGDRSGFASVFSFIESGGGGCFLSTTP